MDLDGETKQANFGRMIKICRKPGWNLNSNDKVVNAILARIEKNNGECPCSHPENDGDLHCPCDSYKLRDKCCCNLYIKNESTNSK